LGLCCLLPILYPAQAAPEHRLTEWIPAIQWSGTQLPIQFVYDSVDAVEFFARSQAGEEQSVPAQSGLRRLHWDDPLTGLRLVAEMRQLPAFDAMEWTLFFENRSQHDTPILEKVQTGALALPAPKSGDYILHFADGSSEKITDFQPREVPLSAGV